MTSEIGEGITHTLDAAARTLRDEKRLPGTQDLARSVDGYGSRAGDADQQHVDLGVHMLRHALARSEDQQVDIEILALVRPDRSWSGRSARQRGEFDDLPRTGVQRGRFP